MPTVADPESRWTLTPKGRAAVRGRPAEAGGGGELTPERQLRNVAEYLQRCREDARGETGVFLADLVLAYLDGRLLTIPAEEAAEPF